MPNRSEWLSMAQATGGHIETPGGTLCKLCFEFAGDEVMGIRVVPAIQSCYNCDPKHCQCHEGE